MMEQHSPGSTSAVGGGLIGLDWGTSSLRAYLFAPGGRVIDLRSASWGIQHLPAGGYAAAFRQVAGDWQARFRDLPVVAAGMVGSRNGWHEVPYVSCPADAAAIAAGIVPFPSECGLIHLVPGLVQGGSEPDVMRGEETQVVGALERDPALAAQSLLVLPGTHSKWVRVEDGLVKGFSTHLTGELFALLRDHSIIGRPAREASAVADDPAAAAFRRGVDVARASGPAGISGRLFSARSLFLCGQLPAADTLAYLSGMLVGEEIRSVLAGSAEGPRRCVVVGDAALAECYRIALLAFGITHPRACADTAPDGLWQIATAAGLVPRSAVG